MPELLPHPAAAEILDAVAARYGCTVAEGAGVVIAKACTGSGLSFAPKAVVAANWSAHLRQKRFERAAETRARLAARAQAQG